MSYENSSPKWEDHFIQEAVVLDERMSGFDVDSLSKSKLRLIIENRILDWGRYEDWAMNRFNCSSLKESINTKLLKNFIANAQQAHEIYSNYDFWSEDLIPVFIWENQLIVLGLQYNENLIRIKDHIFILAHPDTLSFFAKSLFGEAAVIDELEELERSYTMTMNKIEGLELENNIKPPKLDFSSLSAETATGVNNPLLNELTPPPILTETNVDNPPSIPQSTTPASIWDFITERHEEYSFEAKKQFSAYLVLQIDSNKMTKVFKMDLDLQNEQINEGLFQYNIQDDNPFKAVFTSGASESFSISQLGIELMNFKYVCITALKRADQVVGFLVGFKNSNLSENDQSLLEELAKESAA